MTWMFAYAELMVEHELRQYSAQPALLSGYHRSFDHHSRLLWGTPENPCPVLGLSPGGECWGLAFAVPWSRRRRMFHRLQPTEHADEYRRLRLEVQLRSGRTQTAVALVSRPEYAGSQRWAHSDIEEAFLAAHGTAGRGVEYVRTIVHALQLWGLRDPLIESLWERLGSWRPR